MVHLARSAWRNWWYLFTLGVIAWFAVTAVNVPARVESFRSSAPDLPTLGTLSAKPATASAPVSSGTLQFSVGSFRIRPAKDQLGAFDGELTLDVENTGDKEVKMTPGALRLELPNGASIRAGSTKTVSISRHLSQLIPVTFPIQSLTPGTYKLIYDGRLVYTGKPL